MKIANRNARQYVEKMIPFTGSNLYGELHANDGTPHYIVYSYGPHWPLLVAVHVGGETIWFVNEDKYSLSTSRHMSQCRPDAPVRSLSSGWIKRLAEDGYHALVKARVLEGAIA